MFTCGNDIFSKKNRMNIGSHHHLICSCISHLQQCLAYWALERHKLTEKLH